MVVVGLTALGCVVLGVMALTALGQRRRGAGIGVATAAGLFFPVAWVAWYLRDEQPRRRVRA